MIANKVRMLTISEANVGQRLDNFLILVLKGMPKSHVYRIIRKGEVRVNKGRRKPDYKLQLGDIVRVPPVKLPDKQPDPVIAKAHQVNDWILWEDEQLLVVNKPPGLAVHGGSGMSYGLIEALRVARPEAKFLELVHRLDRDTSGCLLVAKSRHMLRQLHESLRESSMGKQYSALVLGSWPENVVEVNYPLKKNILQSGERIVKVDKTGKAAISHFHLVEQFERCSLINVTIFTGRTHQIRVHAAHQGHPIAGDEKYGDKAINKNMRQQGLTRMFLHASKVQFYHPLKKCQQTVVAPLPPQLQKVLDNLV